MQKYDKAKQMVRVAGALTALTLASMPTLVRAQKPQARITAPVVDSNRVAVAGSANPRARAGNDVGTVPREMPLQGMKIVLSRSDAQEADLQGLIAAQQNPKSALYQKWLSPDQFASRFGVADEDLAKVSGWLEQQGFAVTGISRSRDRVIFSGTAAQVQAAFGTPVHYFKSAEGETHYAPFGDLTIPAAFAGSIRGVTNLTDFRPKPRAIVKPNFTSSQGTFRHFLSPKDVATIYDINAAYNAGYTGTNQSIAVVGQSSVTLSDISNFQTAAGLTPKAPTVILVPNTGASTESTGDEGESDLDLEYTGGIAKGATIYFVYVGNGANASVFDAVEYAIDEHISPIISVSYGLCETALSSTDYASLNGILAQAATQGQSIISASGDSGSTDCYPQTSLTTTQRMALAADFPASSQYVTGMGGTELTTDAVAPSNTQYWTPSTGSDVISSALSYMPEMVWNDDNATTGLSSGGGGTSVLTARPSWQTGVTGIPSGSFRLVPDISLAASPNNAGYLYCSSDTTSTKVTGSCSNGFRDSSNVGLTVAGGTSFAAPIFAGMLAIINQSRNSTGQGVINPILYNLASSSSTYASAFHDTTNGGNQCLAGTTYCTTTGAGSYAATTGYDEASGLGSIDFNALLTAWPTTAASALQGSSTSLSAATLTPTASASDVVTITVSPVSTSLTATPTGTVTLLVDGVAQPSALTLTNGIVTYTFSSPTAGSHTIVATYSGDSTYAGSKSTLVLSIASISSNTGSFAVSAPNLTVSAGSSGSTTVTVTPAGGYTGTVGWTLSASSALTNACYNIANVTVPGTAAVTTSLTIFTSATLCSTAGSVGANGLRKLGNGLFTSNQTPSPTPFRPGTTSFAFAALVAAGLLSGRRGRRKALLPIAFIAIVGFGFSGCGGSGGSTGTPVSGKTATTTTLTSSTTSQAAGSAVTLTAGVAPSAATGTVTFANNGTSLGTGTLSSGAATFTTSSLPVGSNAITAVYGGDSTYASSTSAGVTVTTTSSTSSPLGTYTLTLKGTDTATSTITASTTLTLTVD